jgi:hypothetical protein
MAAGQKTKTSMLLKMMNVSIFLTILQMNIRLDELWNGSQTVQGATKYSSD